MANGVSVLDPNFLRRGLATQNAQDIKAAQAAAQPQPLPRPPSLFDQVQTGLFSQTGVTDPALQTEMRDELGFFGEGLFGIRGRRILGEFQEKQFDIDQNIGIDFLERDLGRELTAGEESTVGGILESGFGMAGLQQFGQQLAQDLPEAVAARQQAVQRAETERRTRQAQAATAESQQAIAAETVRRIPLENLERIDALSREQRAVSISNRRDFISDIEGNPALASGSKSLLAADQLDNLLTGDFTALDLSVAAVAFTNIMEPGLAVREDDRIAFTRGAQSGFNTLRNIANQFASGEINAQEAALNVRESMNSIMRPRAQSMVKSIGFWQGVGRSLPGVVQGDVVGTLGLSERQKELLQIFSSDEGSQPAIRQIQVQQ